MWNNLKRMSFVAVVLLGANDAVAAENDRSPSERSRARVEKEVHHELVMLPFYGVFDNFAYKVEGNAVTLLGQVTRPTLKSNAEAVLKRIEGVDRVNNQIEVFPVSPNDDRIRIAVYQAIYASQTLNRYALRAVPTIHIIVKGGHVTLEGAVATEADKNVANIRANGVSGVFSVKNNLHVDRS